MIGAFLWYVFCCCCLKIRSFDFFLQIRIPALASQMTLFAVPKETSYYKDETSQQISVIWWKRRRNIYSLYMQFSQMEGVQANTPVWTGLHRTARVLGAASVGAGKTSSSISRCINNSFSLRQQGEGRARIVWKVQSALVCMHFLRAFTV